ncbi:MAG: adenylate/guanylate cyclase domain-containing protein, partial [Actinomycetota bacterium]
MPQADDETYSFMFTDVESSSVLWEDYGEAMGRSLELHDDIIRNVSAAHDGHIVKHLGDGMYVVFESAPSAVGCAVALMAALQAEEFPELNDPLKVRIGVHTGSARARDGDYFGRAVNRAARVSDTANGDQIVVSEATKELCPDVDFDDHGTHELKGVGVERLYLLRSPRLKVDDRPLRVSKPSNLPTDSSAFIGRSEEVTGIAERLDEARGMTLVGPGGVGKTRLALRVAKHIAPRFPDGAFLCPLDSVAAADSVGPAVAEVLGATAIPGMTYAASIGTYLERRKALIILDNCEHVLGEAR